MSFSKKELFREINKNKRYKDSTYVEVAMEQIDISVDHAELDNTFYEEYYKLKKQIEVIGALSPSIIVGLISSAVISYALEKKIAAFWLLIICLGFVCLWLIDNTATKQSCVLEPYLLKKMEEKIQSRPQSTKNSTKHTPKNHTAQNRFWAWMIVITLVSLLTTFIFGSEIPWNELNRTHFSWSLTKSILYDISVG